MRTFAAILAIAALPTASLAQAGAPAQRNPAAVGVGAPRLDATNHWRAYQVGCWNTIGCASPKIGVVFNAIGPLEGENNLFDGVSYNGFSQYQAERYDHRDGRFVPVGANEVVGGYLGAAFDGKGDPADAGVLLFTTETQTPANNGMGLELDYTPNGSTALSRGLSVSPQGRGGVTIGGGYASNNPYEYKGPADLGQGSLNAAGAIVTGDHFRSDGAAPTLSACGAGAKVTGTDAAGFVTTGGAVTSCTVNFAKAYRSAPVCIVQTFANAAPVTYVTSYAASALKVAWNGSLNGTWLYICQGVS